MAENFLSRCPSYMREASGVSLRIRETICGMLRQSDYKFKRGDNQMVFRAVNQQLRDLGLSSIGQDTFMRHRLVYTYAHMFLNATPQFQETILDKAIAEKADEGIRGLIADGITAWEQIDLETAAKNSAEYWKGMYELMEQENADLRERLSAAEPRKIQKAG